jgi:iron(III) transport system ATP-binding protein
MIEVDHISKSHRANTILHDVSFRVETGSSLALVGHSGSGKTTLLRMIAGLDKPDTGTIRTSGKLSMVFQSLALWPHMTVTQHLEAVLHDSRWNDLRAKRVNEMLSTFGLTSWINRKPGTLSGGEQQRLALARAFAPDHDILLLDEPLTHLDVEARSELRAIIQKFSEGKTMIVATHDEEDAEKLADSQLHLSMGKCERVIP